MAKTRLSNISDNESENKPTVTVQITEDDIDIKSESSSEIQPINIPVESSAKYSGRVIFDTLKNLSVVTT